MDIARLAAVVVYSLGVQYKAEHLRLVDARPDIVLRLCCQLPQWRYGDYLRAGIDR